VIEPLSPEILAWLRQSAAVGVVTSQVLVNLLERVEALEARPIPGSVELAAPTPEAVPVATLSDALISAEAALSDIAEGEETSAAPNTFEWAEQRCAEALATIRPVMQRHGIRTSEHLSPAQLVTPYGKSDEQARRDRAGEAGKAAADVSIEAVLAAQPAPPTPPAPEVGEVGELVAALEQDADRGEQFYDLSNTTAEQFTRAAELLQQQESRIANLRSALTESGRAVGLTIGNECSDSFLLQVPQEVRLAMRKAAPAPAVVPVAVSERLPDPRPETEGGDCDAEGRCWWFSPPACFTPELRPCWTLDSEVMEGDTHWCPFHAIPLPQAGEVEGV
jgi:hypothetical protein